MRSLSCLVLLAASCRLAEPIPAPSPTPPAQNEHLTHARASLLLRAIAAEEIDAPGEKGKEARRRCHARVRELVALSKDSPEVIATITLRHFQASSTVKVRDAYYLRVLASAAKHAPLPPASRNAIATEMIRKTELADELPEQEAFAYKTACVATLYHLFASRGDVPPKPEPSEADATRRWLAAMVTWCKRTLEASK